MMSRLLKPLRHGGMANSVQPPASKVGQGGAKQPQHTFLQRLGPGLITGAADDDPSGIATYSQAGAQFGFALLWTMWFSLPLMTAIQEICARLGRTTGLGIAANLKKAYSKYVAFSVVALLCVANLFNLGADISAMGAAAQLVSGGSAVAYGALFGGLSLLLQIFIPYRRYVRYLRWLTWSLLAYVLTAFLVRVQWSAAFRSMALPAVSLDVNYLMALVGVLGTTISPYLFFWQTSEEAEEVRVRRTEAPLRKKPWQAAEQFRRIALDTRVGMAISNFVAFFIILTTGATLHASGTPSVIASSADAAKALEPLAGKLAFWLFACGILGTGLLAVPVLAGSAAYAVAELLHWPGSLEYHARGAPKFYGVLAAAMLGGVGLNLAGIDPIRALFWAAVVNGIVAVPVMFLIMLMSANRHIVGPFLLPLHLRIGGWIATVAMLLATLFFAISTFWHGLR
jgi:NRAMP (natural resistance-associated macrophage protein)-like metal ion transporter